MHSRFNVVIDCKRQTSGISPGMHVKLIIFFRCDILDEPEEILIINVQQGRSVIIKLRGYRDSPILQSKFKIASKFIFAVSIRIVCIISLNKFIKFAYLRKKYKNQAKSSTKNAQN